MELGKEERAKHYRVPKNSQLISRILLEFLAVGGVGVFLMARYVMNKSKKPYKRGFYCDDENIKHPYNPETISESACAIIWVIIGLTVIPTVEFVHFKVYKFEDWKAEVRQQRGVVSRLGRIPSFLVELYRILGYFLVGLLVCLVTTQIAKYQIGRLRPYFLYACNTQLTVDLCKEDYGSLNFYKFAHINHTECKGPWEDYKKLTEPNNNYHWVHKECKEKPEEECIEDIMNEARKSFMSGHSSFSFYCSTFLIIYLHSRLSTEQPPGSTKNTEGTRVHRIFLRGLKVLKPFLQFLFFMLAFWIALTRISDYRHHPMDVVTGTVVGIAFSFLILFGLVDIFNRPRSFTAVTAKYHLSPANRSNLERSDSQDTNISEVDSTKKKSTVSTCPG